MKIPQFNNKENELVELKDGRMTYLSRHVAVCISITALDKEGNKYALVSRRGIKTPNYQGYINITCGYLDYNETIEEAAKRETWEETGVNLDAIPKENIIYGIENQPWRIGSIPKGSQNITIHHGVILKFKSKKDFPKLTNKYAEKEEVGELYWMPHDEVLSIKETGDNPYDELTFAFNHYYIYRDWNKIVEERQNE